MNIMKELLPAGSVVLLKGGSKKTMIIGVLQVMNDNPEEVYDYIGVPYPEGYIGAENVYAFQHDDINDVIFKGYQNPERDEFVELAEIIMKKAEEQLT